MASINKAQPVVRVLGVHKFFKRGSERVDVLNGLNVEVPEDLTAAGSYELELRASHTWQPRPDDAHDRDDRELSVAVCNIEALT